MKKMLSDSVSECYDYSCILLHRVINKSGIQACLITFVLAFLCCEGVMGIDYYVSLSGKDINSGTSVNSAWASIAKVSSLGFKPGDRILFEGGSTFKGTFALDSIVKGSPASRIVITSYGKGRATLNGGTTHAIWLNNCEYITIFNINVTGDGRKTGNVGGRGIYIQNSNNIIIDNIDAQGFQKAGVEVNTCKNVSITRVYANNNGFAGIFADATLTIRNENIYIGYCRAINNPGDPTVLKNHSGNGILYYKTNNSMIEYCESAENGWDQPVGGQGNGPVGIWLASSSNVTIQYCISHNNHSTSGDGGGFDFDGGTQNSILQYCYSYNNYSSGMLFWEYGSRSGIKNNTVRYSIFENDREGGFRFGTSGPGGVSNINIYNNIVYNEKFPAVNSQGGEVNNVFFRNNIFISGSDTDVVRLSDGYHFQGNCYWRTNGTFKIGDFTDFATWVKKTGQEQLQGKIVGVFADPLLREAGKGEKMTDPTKLPQLFAYMLQEGSPCIGKGLDIRVLFGIYPGNRDFFGNFLTDMQRNNIGVQEMPVVDR